jgi:hypothetical protein
LTKNIEKGGRMQNLFVGKEIFIDFINHLDQSDFVFLGMQKPIDEMTRCEIENALLMSVQLESFWRRSYDLEVEAGKKKSEIINSQDEIIKMFERKIE